MEKESETNAPVLTDKEQKIAEMQAKYKKVYVLSPGCDPKVYVIFKPAGRAEFRQVKLDQDHDVYKNMVDERLIQACVVYPDRITLMALLDEYPFFEGPLVREIVTVSGGGVAKK
jgi:hypothetical protein